MHDVVCLHKTKARRWRSGHAIKDSFLLLCESLLPYIKELFELLPRHCKVYCNQPFQESEFSSTFMCSSLLSSFCCLVIIRKREEAAWSCASSKAYHRIGKNSDFLTPLSDNWEYVQRGCESIFFKGDHNIIFHILHFLCFLFQAIKVISDSFSLRTSNPNGLGCELMFQHAHIKQDMGCGLMYQHHEHLRLKAYSNTSYTREKGDWKSTLGCCTHLGNSLVTLHSNKQNVVSWPSIEVEYWAMVTKTCETRWIHSLIQDLDILQSPSHMKT